MTARTCGRRGARRSIAALVAVAAGLALLVGCGQKAPPAAERKVTFNMSWLPQGSMVGAIVALDRGLYASRHLNVELVRGFGGTRTTNEVDQGMFEFGYGDPLSVVLNRAHGGHARLVGIINQQWPAGLCYIREKHSIAAPADLKGLVVGGGQNSAVQTLLPLWLRQNGVDPATVQILQLNPSVIIASLIEGKIDAAECWRGNSRPLFVEEAKKAGLALDWLEYRQFGLDIYGSGVITTDRLIAEQPDVVRGFVQATFEGYAWAAQHPAEALEIVLKRYPMLDRTVTSGQIAEILALIASDAGAGSAQDAKMSRTLAFLAAANQLDGKLTADVLYTNQFLAAH